MSAVRTRKSGKKPLVLTSRFEQVLKAVYFYRFMSALDVAYRLFSPGSVTYVRDVLSELAGGRDYEPRQYLYRFPLPGTLTGNSPRVYTLGSRGRDFLANEIGRPVNWYFRPEKVKHFSHSHVMHSLLLTRFLVAALNWSKKHPEIRLARTRISYELAQAPAVVQVSEGGRTETLKVVPDAWLLFERVRDGKVERTFPVLFEIDRGTEYRRKFKQHVASRLELIRSGAYSEWFGVKSVAIAYATTGETPEYRATRLRSMCAWTSEVLSELGINNWSSLFRFHSLTLEGIYEASLFGEPVWLQPDALDPVPFLGP